VLQRGALQRNIWTNGFECCQGASPAPGTTASGILLVGDKVLLLLLEYPFTYLPSPTASGIRLLGDQVQPLGLIGMPAFIA
jgi:hypothetical protein